MKSVVFANELFGNSDSTTRGGVTVDEQIKPTTCPVCLEEGLDEKDPRVIRQESGQLRHRDGDFHCEDQAYRIAENDDDQGS
jgi:hypothetical protein